MVRRTLAVLIVLLMGSWISGPDGTVRAARVPTGVITSGPSGRPVVALTFDGGPSHYTTYFVRLLQRNYVVGTFFVTGAKARAYPGVIRAASGAGDQIGNGAYSGRDLESLATPHVVANLTETQAAIREASGVSPAWFRPPFANVDPRIAGIVASLGLRTVTWSVDSGDDVHSSIYSTEANVLDNVQWGSIILLHDAGRGRLRSLAALSAIIYRLKRVGYRFATLDELFGLQPLPACAPDEERHFASAGIKPATVRAFYRTWLNLVCRGINLGPATSSPHRMKHKIEALDFEQTAHQMQLEMRTGRTKVVTVLSWASQVFKARHVKPKPGLPITRSWYSHFLNGVNWGPALKNAKRDGLYVVQQFLHGWAVEGSNGVVTWHKHLNLNHM